MVWPLPTMLEIVPFDTVPGAIVRPVRAESPRTSQVLEASRANATWSSAPRTDASPRWLCSAAYAGG